MYLPSWATQRLKSPGLPHWIFAAPLPWDQYALSRSTPAASLGVASRPATTRLLADYGLGRLVDNGLDVVDHDGLVDSRGGLDVDSLDVGHDVLERLRDCLQL